MRSITLGSTVSMGRWVREPSSISFGYLWCLAKGIYPACHSPPPEGLQTMQMSSILNHPCPAGSFSCFSCFRVIFRLLVMPSHRFMLSFVIGVLISASIHPFCARQRAIHVSASSSRPPACLAMAQTFHLRCLSRHLHSSVCAQEQA